MKKSILICTATELEISFLRNEISNSKFKDFNFTFLITGIGLVNTGIQLGICLAQTKFDFAFQVGIAGSYEESIKILDCVEVTEEIFGDLGVQLDTGFQSMDEMGFKNFQFKEKNYYNHIPNYKKYTTLKSVKGLSSNTISGTISLAEKRIVKWNPDIETMEGAAFFQTCLLQNVPFCQVRSISNYCGVRDKNLWKIKEAALEAQKKLLEILVDFEIK